MSYHKDVHNFGAWEAARIAVLTARSNMPTSEEQIIGEAARAFAGEVFGRSPKHRLLDALEAFAGNGSADEVSGNVESPTGHFFRVDRWIVVTDSQGFRDVQTYDTESEAEVAFRSMDEEYIQWAGDDE